MCVCSYYVLVLRLSLRFGMVVGCVLMMMCRLEKLGWFVSWILSCCVVLWLVGFVSRDSVKLCLVGSMVGSGILGRKVMCGGWGGMGGGGV